MPEHVEKKLRAALSQRATQLDPDMIGRLRTIDYHPRLGALHRIRRSVQRLMRRRQLPPR